MSIAFADPSATVFGRLVDAVTQAFAAPQHRVTYYELMNLSDRQLEDIGLTRGLVELAGRDGGEGIRALRPDGAFAAALGRTPA